MIHIFRSKYTYPIRDETYTDEAWFVECDGKISQPLTWHEALGTVVQIMGENGTEAPVYWPSDKPANLIGEKF